MGKSTVQSCRFEFECLWKILAWLHFFLWPQCWDMESQYSLGVTKKPASFMFSKSIYFVGIKRRNKGYPFATTFRDQYILFTPSYYPLTSTNSEIQTPREKKPGSQEKGSTLGELTSVYGRQEERQRSVKDIWLWLKHSWKVDCSLRGLWHVAVLFSLKHPRMYNPPDTPAWKRPAWLN